MNDMDLKNKVSYLLELYINLICHQSTAIYEELEENGNNELEQGRLKQYELKIRKIFNEAAEISSEYIGLEENDFCIDYKKINMQTELMKKIRDIGINVANISRTIRDEWKSKEFAYYIEEVEKLSNEIIKIDKLYKECSAKIEESLKREEELKKENNTLSSNLRKLEKDYEIIVNSHEETSNNIKQIYEEQLKKLNESDREKEEKKEKYYKKGLETLKGKYKAEKEISEEKDTYIKQIEEASLKREEELKIELDKIRSEVKILRKENEDLQKKSNEIENDQVKKVDLKEITSELKRVKLELQALITGIVQKEATKIEGNNIPQMGDEIMRLFTKALRVKEQNELVSSLNVISSRVEELRYILKSNLKEDELNSILDELEKIKRRL